MCLVITKRTKAKVAKKDIVCYKIILSTSKDVLVTAYRCKTVCIGETYTSELDRTSYHMVEAGLHAFKYLRASRLELKTWPLYSVTPHIAKCIIPAGSTYYKGKFLGCTSYAADQMKYIKLI